MGKRIRCKGCNDVIESLDRHDFRKCKCGAIFVDGGSDYTRYGWPGEDSPEEWIEVLADGQSPA